MNHVTKVRPDLLSLAGHEALKRVPGRDPLFLDIQDFLTDEAELLNAGQLQDWLALLAPDIDYFMPVRVTKMNGSDDGFSNEHGHFEEDYTSLVFRVGKLATPSSWGENPASRTRRLISNLRVFTTPVANEYQAITSFVVVRSRLSSPHVDLLSGLRRDVIRKTEDGFLLVARRILADETTIGMPNLAIFL